MLRVPTFTRNTRNQLTHVGYRDQTPAEQDRDQAWRADQLSIDIKRSRSDANKRADVRGFKESQRFLRDKAWRPDYVRPTGELRGFTPTSGRRRPLPMQTEVAA